MAGRNSKNAASSAETPAVENYQVVASMVGKYSQGTVISGDQLAEAGYNVASLLKKGVIVVHDPEAQAAAEAEKLGPVSPRERELQRQLTELQERFESLEERFAPFEAAFKEAQQGNSQE